MSKPLLFFSAPLCVFIGAMTIFFASGVLDRGAERIASDPNHVAVDDTDSAPELPGEPIESFVLTDQTGSDFHSDSLSGKVWVGSIFFSSCPSMCRMQNMRVAELQQQFAERGVQFVSITCDPDNDTPSVLNDYAKKFGAREGSWHFLTGDLGLIKKIGGQKFGITVDNQVHSDRLILFDRQGELVGTFRSTEPDQFADLNTELEKLLREPLPGEGESQESGKSETGVEQAEKAATATADDVAAEQGGER